MVVDVIQSTHQKYVHPNLLLFPSHPKSPLQVDIHRPNSLCSHVEGYLASPRLVFEQNAAGRNKGGQCETWRSYWKGMLLLLSRLCPSHQKSTKKQVWEHFHLDRSWLYYCRHFIRTISVRLRLTLQNWASKKCNSAPVIHCAKGLFEKVVSVLKTESHNLFRIHFQSNFTTIQIRIPSLHWM